MQIIRDVNLGYYRLMITASIVLHKTDPAQVRSVLDALSGEEVCRVYLVDNSPDDSLKIFAEGRSNVEYHHIDNRGYGNAHNYAIKKAAALGADYHLVLNPDVRWEGGILCELTRIMDDNSRVGLVQPRICYPDGTLQHTCRLLPTPLDVFAKRFLPSKLTRRRINRYLLPDRAYNSRFNAVYMQGSFMLFRVEALKNVGMFDERFFMYPEDIDITRRIRRQYDAMYVPEITIVHDHAASSSKFGRMMWIHIINMVRYFNKWGWFMDSERHRLNRQLLHEIGQPE